MTSARVRIGISGWTYAPWRGVFYPTGLRQADELRYAAERMSSIEINGSFYSLQKPASWTKWRDETPDDFVFSVKAPRFITHIKKLDDVAVPIANFLASGLLALGPKLGPILWQLPPSLHADVGLLESFLALLPRSTAAALEAARGHDARVEGRSVLEIDADRPLHHVVEPRSASFDQDHVRALFARAHVAVVLGDSAGRWPVLDWPTGPIAYARLHGDEVLYESGYDDAALDRWAGWVRGQLAAGRDTYVYFDNDTKVRAPVDAMALRQRLDS
ncbi:MAG: DUF72 domain-containing protein [Actinomycetales bacterium]|nr:DUF72 domain-containing protein [Actinomycetales bacterium]